MERNDSTALRALVIDDEAPARQRLMRMLRDVGGVEVVGQADNGLVALAQIEELEPDIAFLDIEMPELSGLEVARSLGEDRPAVVFVTAYDQFALEAFDLAAVDYLVKPIARDRLAATVDRVRQIAGERNVDFAKAIDAIMARSSANRTRVAVRLGSNFEVVETSSISAIVTQDHYAAIIVGSRELLSEDSLDAIVTRLDPRTFFRCHRSAIVNLDFLSRLERLGDRKYVAVLDDPMTTEVPISRDKLRELKSHLDVL